MICVWVKVEGRWFGAMQHGRLSFGIVVSFSCAVALRLVWS